MDNKTRSILCGTVHAISMIEAAFGAPIDHGYDTPEGKALYTLYLLQADLVGLLQNEDAAPVEAEGGA